jgi:hypothetical protein
VPPANNGDLDGDGDADFDDISDFVDQLTVTLLAGGASSSVAPSSTGVKGQRFAPDVDAPLATDLVAGDREVQTATEAFVSATAGNRRLKSRR